MQEKIDLLISECLSELEKASTLQAIRDINVKYLGKNGEFTALLKGLKDVAPQDRPMMGNLVNAGKNKLGEAIALKENKMLEDEKQARLIAETVDITLPSNAGESGTLHPLTIVKNEIVEILTGMGFEALDGPEIESDYYNFQQMNIPADHPARDMQDTFYITESLLLRTHTSPMQARVMEKTKPPIRIIVPGKVYRSDDDASHSPMFQQIEGLYVDKSVTLCDLKATLDQLAKAIFDKSSKVRLRPSYFPFTEPSVEADVSCSICGGKGCRICKGTGWIEILGAGIVNPQVIKNCGLDPKEYKGFAFGLGIERITMIKYGIPDMRILFENDLRFLRQYK